MQTPRLEGRELETGTDRNEIEEGLAQGVIYGAVAGQSEKWTGYLYCNVRINKKILLLGTKAFAVTNKSNVSRLRPAIYFFYLLLQWRNLLQRLEKFLGNAILLMDLCTLPHIDTSSSSSVVIIQMKEIHTRN